MPVCPFQNRECFPECALFAPGIGKCCFVAQTMLLEDLQQVAVVAYRMISPPEEGQEGNNVES